jgi:hypothetical protein
MANQKIHEYLLERFSIGDDDFFDIDYFDGAVYTTAKVKGSVIKAIAGGVNIYNSDGTLLSDRTLDADGNTLTFDSLRRMFININPAPIGVTGMEVSVVPNGALFSIKDSTSGEERFKILQNGQVQFNQEYSFPLLDGAAGQILITDGAGNITFQNAPTTNNFYNSDGQLTSDRTVDGNNLGLEYQNLNFLSANVLGVTPQTDLIQISGNPTNVIPGARLFTVLDTIASKRRLAVLKSGEIEVNEEYKFPLTDGTDGQGLLTDGLGNLTFQNIVTDSFVNFGQTQWSVVAPATTLPTGQIANGFSFFTEANKVAAGTTSYDEYFLSYGRRLTLTGTSGQAQINILGNNFNINYGASLLLTAALFVANNQAAINALGVQVFANNGVLRFGSTTQTDVSTITITNVSGTLNGTFDTAIIDHVVIPYAGTAYAGQRLSHSIRVNFNIDAGNEQRYALSLRRWQDDSLIGSILQVERHTTLTGQQQVFTSYTAGATDPFVTGGFYFALDNQSGQSVTISGTAGILIISEYQKPTKF